MAGSCEISNILSKYNSTMYQQEESQLALDVLGHPGDDGSLGLSFPPSLPPVDTTETPEWFSELPYFWTKVQVLEWISYHVEKNKYDASIIDFSCCNMDGHTLCHCSRDQMRHIFGPLGDELYDRLHEITSDELTWIIDLLEKEDANSQETFLDTSHLELANPCAKDSLEDLKPTNPFLFTDITCSPDAMSPGSSDVSGPAMSHSPNSQDSGGSDLDLDPVEAKLFPDGELRASPLGREGRACASHLGTSPEHPSASWDVLFYFYFFSVPWALFSPLSCRRVGRGRRWQRGEGCSRRCWALEASSPAGGGTGDTGGAGRQRGLGKERRAALRTEAPLRRGGDDVGGKGQTPLSRGWFPGAWA
uniref:E74 like ETS transcription factor 3 n=1 Tax=Anser cygnoides TaxID=8845 RepID=A0A8B9D6W3_ANSCY